MRMQRKLSSSLDNAIYMLPTNYIHLYPIVVRKIYFLYLYLYLYHEQLLVASATIQIYMEALSKTWLLIVVDEILHLR